MITKRCMDGVNGNISHDKRLLQLPKTGLSGRFEWFGAGVTKPRIHSAETGTVSEFARS